MSRPSAVAALIVLPDAIVASVRSPRDVLWYDAEHELNAAATRDRIAWLKHYLERP